MKFAIALLLLAGSAPKPIYKITRLSSTEVGISCTNGADPTGRKVGETVIMSCGKE